ncbi:MAG TPA: DUF3501 family protein [Acidimicrobiales bacterium]|nr:DUF3501 family protein [Acidimicrobiales bacterium]
MSRKLTLDDISDLREYEREREEFRTHVIALKKRRRVGIGPFVTVVFENRDTIRFQIQEMARVEKLISDEAIEGELRAYNPLVPEPGELACTLFIELTSELALREWLPRLVGIEQSLELRIGSGEDRIVVPCIPDEEHAEQLTRDEITASVHYLHFRLDPDQVDAMADGPVELAVVHPEYEHATSLSEETTAELLADLRP